MKISDAMKHAGPEFKFSVISEGKHAGKTLIYASREIGGQVYDWADLLPEPFTKRDVETYKAAGEAAFVKAECEPV